MTEQIKILRIVAKEGGSISGKRLTELAQKTSWCTHGHCNDLIRRALLKKKRNSRNLADGVVYFLNKDNMERIRFLIEEYEKENNEYVSIG